MVSNRLYEEEIPSELDELFDKAQAGAISPAEFGRKLEQNGITGFRKMLYTGRAFGLPLNQVKEMYIEERHGSEQGWLDEIGLSDGATLEEISKSDQSPSD